MRLIVASQSGCLRSSIGGHGSDQSMMSLAGIHHVSFNDTDINGHMNNANYIRIANEYLPEGYKYNNVRVEFKIPARFGQSLVPQTLSTADGTFFVELSLDGKTSTLIEFK